MYAQSMLKFKLKKFYDKAKTATEDSERLEMKHNIVQK